MRDIYVRVIRMFICALFTMCLMRVCFRPACRYVCLCRAVYMGIFRKRNAKIAKRDVADK